MAFLAVAAALVALAFLLPAEAVARGDPGEKTTLADIDGEVMCPVCGTPLELASEAPQAERERAFIRRLAVQGRSEEEIKTALVAEFGEEVLALPPSRGFNRAAYLVPVGALLAALALVSVAGVEWRRRRASAWVAATVPPVGDAARLEADLERYDL